MDQTSARAPKAPAIVSHHGSAQLFAGGGETGAALAAIDWANTSLGPVEGWPQTLRTSVRICLSSRHPIILWWGPDLIVFYNDAYAPTLGIKRPWAAGRPGREVWSEIWDTIGPMLDGVLRTGEPTWSDDQLLFLERSGFPEETYHTFSYSPIEDDTGAVMGVFTAVTETTQRVLSERRTVLARDLAAALVEARSTEDVCACAARILATDPNDVPFALLYGIDADSHKSTLLGATGVASDSPLSPLAVNLNETKRKAARGQNAGDPWSLTQAMKMGQPIVTHDIAWGEIPLNAQPGLRPHDALALPLIEPGQKTATAVLVAGISPRRELDDDYHTFYHLLASHLATALAASHAYETERKRAEALAEIDRAKTTFFSNVSHEFRTPLTLIMGPLEDSLSDLDETLSLRQRERLMVIRRNSVRLLKLVNTLLDVARIEAGRVRAVYEPTNLATYTAELASAFRSLIEKAGLTLVVDCPPLGDLPAPIYVDHEMWEKIVLNLLSNAFKFTFSGTIIVKLSAVESNNRTATAIELMVRDTGAGIPASELPLLFERFHRVEGMRSRTHEGSGIGLTLVQELVHLHGGTIRVESVEGTGTAFFVRLPLGSAHLPADRVAPADSAVRLSSTALGAVPYVEEAGRWLSNDDRDAQADGRIDEDSHFPPNKDLEGTVATASQTHPTHILVADDNADMREYLRRLLSEQFTVTAVTNGAQALAAIKRPSATLPDLVLTDIMMPELDGFGLLHAMRSDPITASIPVMMLSARAGEEATVEGLQAGADDYLVKPFSAREVVTRVQTRLEITRVRAESERHTRQVLDAILHMAQSVFNPPDSLSFATTQDAAEQDAAKPGDTTQHVEYLVAHRLAMLTCDVTGCKRVSIMAVDPETDMMRAVSVVGLTPEQESQWWDEQRALEAQGMRLGAGENPDEVARFRAGEIFVVDMTQSPLNELPNPYGITTSLVAPMRAGDSLVGILSLDFGGPPHTFTDDERALAGAVAHLGAVALERDHLLRASAEAKAREIAAVEARRQMGEFLGIASHELRTPLTSITANLQMARRQLKGLCQNTDENDADTISDQTNLTQQLQRATLLLERTDRQLARLDRLVGDLVDAARIQAGRLELHPERCDLLAIVRDAVYEQQTAWPHRNIALNQLHRATVLINADADRIGQVITNLLTNALKYSLDGAQVVIAVRVLGKTVRVEVRDQGPGLSAEQQDHLWERFYRVPGIEQLSGSGVGLGLGLNICKTIVERHNGEVGVESAPGAGSTFWFTIPAAASA